MAIENKSDSLINTKSQIEHYLGQVSAIIFMINRNRDKALIAYWASINKTNFLKGLRGISLRKVPTVGVYTYEYIQSMIEVAESMDWTNINDLQRLFEMKKNE